MENKSIFRGIIGVDFDDTLYVKGMLDKRMAKRVNRLFDKGWFIVIYTARLSRDSGIIRSILSGLKYDMIKTDKLRADFYLDDKNLTEEKLDDLCK